MELSQVLQALRNADAAGDTEAAKRLAEIAKQLMAEGASVAAKPAPEKRSGILASASKGLESLISSGRTAVGALTGDPNVAASAALERGREIESRYADEIGLERLKQAYEKSGVLSAAGELGRQIPRALAEQAPNIATTLSGARLGAMAGAPFGPAGAIVGGISGAAIPGLVQMFGSNVERQAAEQVRAGRPISVDVGAAGAAAVPQTALDVAGTFIPLGGRLVSKLTGIPAEALLGKSAAQVARLAEERLATTLAKGTAVGVAAEVPTEVLQQMLERAQAGLPLTSDDALKEYGETAYQVSLLGPLGAAGRLAERSGARTEVEELAAERARAQREEARRAQEEAALAQKTEAESFAAAARFKEAQEIAEEAARRQRPEYLDELERRFAALKQREAELTEAANIKVDTSDTLAVEGKRRAREALNAFKKSDEYKNTIKEYKEAYEALRPRVLERQRVERVGAAPAGTQLDVLGEPAGTSDQSLAGQIKSLETFASSFDKQIAQAQKAGDTQQVALLQQKQLQAREQLAALVPDPVLLQEAKQRATQRLEEYQTQIKTLAEKEEPTAEDYKKLRELNDVARQIRQAIADMDDSAKLAQKYRPTEVIKAVDKEKERKRLQQKLAKQGTLGEDVGKTLEQLQALEQVQEQPALFGEEDLLEVKPRDLGDLIAAERKQIKDLQSMALMFAEQARQAQAQRGVVRRTNQELLEEARKIAEQVRDRNAELNNLEQLNRNLTQLNGQLRALQAQNKPIPEGLTARIARTRKSIDVITTRLAAQTPVVEAQRELLPAADTGEFAPRVTDEELMAQRDRDIEALLDQYLAPALGVKETKETLAVPTPEGEREVRLTTLGGESYAALRQELENVNQRRDDAVIELFDSKGATANALRSEIAMLAVREVEIIRKLNKLAPLSGEYRQDLQKLVHDSFQRPSAVPKGPPNLAEQRYLTARADLRAIEDETLDAIYEMRKLEYQLQSKGLPDVTRRSWSFLEGEGPEKVRPGSTAELIQENPVIQAGMAAQRRLSAAQRRVDELAKALPELPDLTQKSLDDKLDGLIAEFAEGSPQELAQISKARRVATGQRPPALAGADISARIAYNESQIKQIRQDLKYAGRPTIPDQDKVSPEEYAERVKKVEERDALVAELKPLLAENKQLKNKIEALRGKYGKAFEAAPAPAETGEIAEMRRELAGVESALASGMYKDNAKLVQQLEAARDELRGRIEAAVGPQRPEAAPEETLLPGMAQRFAQFEYRPVAPEALAKARTEYVNATQKINDIRQALSRLDEMGPKYFQEVATTYQQNIDSNTAERTRINKKITALEERIKDVTAARDRVAASNRSETEKSDLLDEAREQIDDATAQIKDAKEELEVFDRRSKDLEQAQTEVTKFLNLARLAGVGKGQDLRAQLDQALDKALADKDKKEAAIKDLEARQRMYEQQEAAKRGVELGDIEAERITSGKAEGFVSGRGKALAEKPKSKRSWVISTDSKAPTVKPGPLGQLEAATQSAFNLLAQAKKETAAATTALAQAPTPAQLATLKNELQALERRIAESYSPDAAKAIAAEIVQLRERLAALPAAPTIADIAAQYAKVSKAKKGEPAHLGVSRLQWKLSRAVLEAAAKLRQAEQAVAAAETNYDNLVKTYKQAEKRLNKLKDPKKIQGVRLQMSNLYALADTLRDKIADANTTRSAAETKYMAAHLEQLLLQQQVGESAKTEAANLTARLTGAADTVTTLTKERDEAVSRETQIRSKLTAAEAAAEKAAEDAKNAREAARNAERIKEEKARRDALDAAAAARQRAAQMRAGIGLASTRVERDTAGALMTAAQADIRKRMAAAETNLGKAIQSKNTADIQKYTKEVQDATVELAQVYGKAPVKKTVVTLEEKAPVEAPKAVEGMRLPARREGPSVRYVRGGSKAIMQAGVTKLRAEGLSQDAANAVSLYAKKNQIAGAKDANKKAALQAQFDEATKGMSAAQVKAVLDEGKRLMGLGPTAELIAKRSAYQTALENVQKAEQAIKDAKTPVQKELARDELEAAEQRRDIAERGYENAKALYETSQLRSAKQAERAAINNLLQEAEETEALRQTGADEDLVPMVYTTATRTPADLLVQEAIRDGRLLDALDRLALEGANDLIRQTARELRPLLLRTKIELDPNLKAKGQDVPAAYSPARNTILFRPTEITDEDIIHEATHAATIRVLRMPRDQLTARQLNAVREIEAIFAKLKKNTDLAAEAGLDNVEEFVSEVQSNVEFRAAIDSQPWYKRLWNAIVRLFSNAPPETVSKRASQLIREIYLPSAKVTTAARDEALASVFRTTKPKYESENALTELADRIIAQPKTFKERMGSNLALEAEMNAIDMRAALQAALKRGADELGKEELFTQAMYNVRKADQFMPLVYTALSNGPLKVYVDEKGLRGITSSNANNAQDIFDAIKNVPGMNTEAKFALASTYMIAQRAANKGLSKLDLGELGLTEDDLAAAMNAANADPQLKDALEEVRALYNLYNEGQINFLAEMGAISKAEAKAWLKDGDYVPYYRVREDGTAELVFGGEKTLTIGDIRTQPYLAELKGGETKILPLNESIIRNTMLITKAALYNNATKEVAYAMQEFGEGKGKIDEKTGKPKNLMPIHRGQGPAGPDIIRFKQEPDPNDPKDDGQRWLRIKTEGTAMEGIPSELVVKSLEGAHLTLPAFLKIGGIAGDWLRKGITRMPPYIFRQLIRDPMAASFTGGLNYGPFRAVVMAGTEFLRSSIGQTARSKNLIEKGLVQSGIFTGDPDDMSAFATQLASGKDGPAIDRLFGLLDRAAMRADASTRALVYESAIKNGLSEVEADMMTMESMNFYKRGLSPTVQYANRLYPFLNAQIQGLNVLAKAMRGNMPFDKRQKIQRKFWNNAVFLFGVGLVYAMAMDDDETFKNAKPRDKYTNFFVHLPGLSEPVKIPLPYESGWFFTAAVALVDAMKAETDGEQQFKALRDIFLASVPGYSSGFLPQAVKPLFEVFTNKNFFSGQNIESAAMQTRSPEDRYSASTTEVAKAMGQVLPLSPVQIEHITRGYFGTAPLALMSVASTFMRSPEKGEPAERRPSEVPLFGTLFQRKYGGADADAMYAFAKESSERAASFKSLQTTGTKEDMREYLNKYRAEIALAPAAKSFETLFGRLRTQEELIRNRKDMNSEEKRARLDQIDKIRQDLAEKFNAAVRKTESRAAS